MVRLLLAAACLALALGQIQPGQRNRRKAFYRSNRIADIQPGQMNRDTHQGTEITPDGGRIVSQGIPPPGVSRALTFVQCNSWPAAGINTIHQRTETVNILDNFSLGRRWVLGTRFTVNTAGTITGFRFYRCELELASDLKAYIYTWDDGKVVRVQTIDPRACSGAGWQKVDFTTPINATPGVTYVVAIDGLSHYRKNVGYYKTAKTSGSITAHGSTYGTTRFVIPKSLDKTVDCYWVDVEFCPPPATPAPTAKPTIAPTLAPFTKPTVPLTVKPVATAQPTVKVTSAPLATAAPTVPPKPGVSECNTWPAAPAQTVFHPSEVPQFLDESDPGVKLVVGLKLRVLKAATLTALRYYKGLGETGTHQGVIYDSQGKAVASTSDTADATCAGGQWVTLPLLQAFRPALNKDYTVVIDGVTTYTLTEGYTGFNTPRGGLLPLGGYYGFKTGRMPITGPGRDNYWIDVVSVSDVPAVTPAPTPAATVPVPFAGVCNGWPAAPLTTVFNSSEAPQFLSEFDGEQVKLVAGLRFRVIKACTVVALRYYKDQIETGASHEGVLYSTDGKPLATTGKFFDDACVGPKWVQMALQKPFNVVPGEQYTAAIDSLSYYTLSEDYRFTDKAGAVTPLGGYYGFKAGRVPATGRGTDNFWVDVVCQPITTPVAAPTISPTVKPAVTPTIKPTLSVTLSPITFVTPIPTVSPTLKPVTGTFTLSPISLVPSPTFAPATLKPIAPLTPSPTIAPTTTITGTILAGGVKCNAWPTTPGSTLYNSTEAPDYTAEGAALVLATRFTTRSPCSVTHFRYYKAADEMGPHQGIVYGVNGNVLATTGIFNDDSCPGPAWVEVPLLKPFRTAAGVEYVVAVDAVTYYPISQDYRWADKAASRLVPNSGMYGLESSVCPDTGSTENYWVDVVCAPDTAALPTVAPTIAPMTIKLPFILKTVQCDWWAPKPTKTIFTKGDIPAETDKYDGYEAGRVLGLRFNVTKSVVITGFRYWKADSETGAHTGFIYNARTGVAVGTTGTFDDSACVGGGKWVTMALQRPFKPVIGREYVVAVDNVVHYAFTSVYPYDVQTDAAVQPLYGVAGTESGFVPLDDADVGANYWLDVLYVTI